MEGRRTEILLRTMGQERSIAFPLWRFDYAQQQGCGRADSYDSM